MRTISIINSKGGCGKTTTAINLACNLGWKGLRVLLVDLDPQGHATLGVNYQNNGGSGLYELFTEQVTIEEIIVKFVVAGIDIIPATETLEKIERFAKDTQWNNHLSLSLSKVSYLYDYVIIDCPSMINQSTTLGMLASDEIIIPSDMSVFSFESIKRVIDKITLFEKNDGISLPFSLLPTMVDERTKFARKLLNQLRDTYPNHVLPIAIHNTVRLREAVCMGIPIIDYDADSTASTDYMYLADHVIMQQNKESRIDVESFIDVASTVKIVA